MRTGASGQAVVGRGANICRVCFQGCKLSVPERLFMLPKRQRDVL